MIHSDIESKNQLPKGTQGAARIEDARARRRGDKQAQPALVSGIDRLRQLQDELQVVSSALAHAEEELARLQARETQARYLAMHDTLTSLPNRRYFQQCVETALSSAQPLQDTVAILYIDLNGFKSVNDVHGHHAGDQVLQIIGARLKNSMRAEDMVCRLGGDEFGCLLTGMKHRRQISQVAAKVYRLLATTVQVGALHLAVPPSIGIALSPADGTTGDALLFRADAAMYHAKHYKTRYTFFRDALPSGMSTLRPSSTMTEPA